MNKKSLAELREVAYKLKEAFGNCYPVLIMPEQMRWLLDTIAEQERTIEALRKALGERKDEK